MAENSAIHSPHLAAQLFDFKGLRYADGIMPTDIDVAVEFRGGLFVFGEGKLPGVAVPDGQRMFLQRMAALAPKDRGLVLIFEHTNRAGLVDVANCPVRCWWWNRFSSDYRWRRPMKPITVRKAIDEMLLFIGLARFILPTKE